MKLRYWKNFSKRKNSTKQASVGYTEIDVYWKEDTSVDNPSVILKGNDSSIDYCYISDFNKYYFVNSPVHLTNGTTEYNLEEDYLASHKTEVGNTVACIDYSSTGYDIWKVDDRLPVKTTQTFDSASASPGVFQKNPGCYVLTIVNGLGHIGMTTQYIVDVATMQDITNELLTNNTLRQEIKEYLDSPWDCILSCKWLPFNISETPGTSTNFIVLGQNTAVAASGTAYMLDSPCVKADTCTVSIPWTYNDFRRTAPYTTLSVWIPGFGYTDLNASELVQDTSLKFEFMLDWGCGDVCCNVIDAVSSEIIKSVSYNVAVDVPLARISLDVGGIVQNTTDVLSSATVTASNIGLLNVAGAITGAFSTLSSGVGLAMSAKKRCISSRGSVGGRSSVWESSDVEIYSFSIDTEDPDDASYIAINGRPVGITHAISNHSGYVKCSNASVSLAGDDVERDRINEYLNSGFYYE